MQYKYCNDENFEDFASGRVFVSKKGLTNFPVRLAQEIYCRCLNYSVNKKDICIYDPCCGGGYLLSVIGLLNGDTVKTIIASDIDNGILNTAKQNVRLATKIGLENKLQNLISIYNDSPKKSLLDAINSAEKLLRTYADNNFDTVTVVFQCDILDGNSLKNMDFKADIVMTDIPYGNLAAWNGDGDGDNGGAVNNLLNNIIPNLKPSSIIAVCSDKKQKITNEKYKRLEKQKIGKRKFEILRLI